MEKLLSQEPKTDKDIHKLAGSIVSQFIPIRIKDAIMTQEMLKTIVKKLSDWILNGTAALQIGLFKHYLLLLKTETFLKSSKQYQFDVNFYFKMVHLLSQMNDNEDLRNFWASQLDEFTDLKFYFYRCIRTMYDKETNGNKKRKRIIVSDILLNILLSLSSPPAKTESESGLNVSLYCTGELLENHDLYSVNKHHKMFASTWLMVMKAELNTPQYRSILAVLHKKIVPFFSRPELLIDFLTDSYNEGGATSLLALNGLFYLIQNYNLDYPDFFPKLYQLLDSHLLHSKHRSRFFRLIQLFLSSRLLSATLVASFIKKLARMCLFAPPGAILSVLPLIHNLMVKHPTCVKLIHLEGCIPTETMQGMNDPFNSEEKDPEKTNAIDSYLWELLPLKRHVLSSVADMARLFDQPLGKSNYELEDFLDLTYDTIFVEESKTKNKAHGQQLYRFSESMY